MISYLYNAGKMALLRGNIDLAGGAIKVALVTSNSIVFEDLGLSLFLVTGEQAVDVLTPLEVNPFLRNLDRWIAGRSV